MCRWTCAVIHAAAINTYIIRNYAVIKIYGGGGGGCGCCIVTTEAAAAAGVRYDE